MDLSPDYRTNPNFVSQSQPNLIAEVKLQYVPSTNQTAPLAVQKVPVIDGAIELGSLYGATVGGGRDEGVVATTAQLAPDTKPNSGNKKRKKYNLNIAGIENYPNLQDSIPHCWSEPAIGNVLRRELEPPVIQQAAFDNTIYRIDITRNVCVREFYPEAVSSLMAPVSAATSTPVAGDTMARNSAVNELIDPSAAVLSKHRNSLPNVALAETLPLDAADAPQPTEESAAGQPPSTLGCEFKVLPLRVETGSSVQHSMANDAHDHLQTQPPQNLRSLPLAAAMVSSDGTEAGAPDEGCISGRLEIRVIPHDQSHADESSMYFDALLPATANTSTLNNVATQNNDKYHSHELAREAAETEMLQAVSPPHHYNAVTVTRTVASTSNQPKRTPAVDCRYASCSGDTVDQPLPAHNDSIGVNINNVTAINVKATAAAAETMASSRASVKTTASDNGNSGTTAALTASKIPILNTTALRHSKCASWAGGDAMVMLTATQQQQQQQQKFSSNLFFLDANTTKNCGGGGCNDRDDNVGSGVGANIYENPNMTDLTPALRRRREADKYVTDPLQLNLRFMRPRSRLTSRTRGIPTFLLGQFDDQSSDNSDEQLRSQRLNNGEEHTGASSQQPKQLAADAELPEQFIKYSDEELLCNMAKDLSSMDNTIRNDITPPPGVPKLENSARLRRYRHNID